MKKQLLYLLLVGLFALGTVSSSQAYHICFDSGEELMIQCKQGNISFTVPDKYLKLDGTLALDLKITIVENDKTLLSFESNSKIVNLPDFDLPKGIYTIVLSLGDYSDAKKVSW